jgi:hypothetical protein
MRPSPRPPRLSSLFLAAPLLLLPAAGRADVVLNGITFIVTDTAGNITGGGNVSYNASGTWGEYVATGGVAANPSYVNTTSTNPNLALDLAAGTYTYSAYLVAAAAAGATALFFDGHTSPGISVLSAANAAVAGTSGYTAWSSTVLALGGSSYATGSGSLSYDNGVSTVTLTDYQAYDDTALAAIGFAGVGPTDLTPWGSGYYAVTFTLKVSNDVPEAPSAWLLLPAVAGLGLLRRTRRA